MPPSLAQRRLPRFSTVTDAGIETGCVLARGTILSVSEDGLFLATPLALPIGARVALTFDVPDLGEARIAALVIYRSRHGDRPGLGLRYLPLANQLGLSRLKAWVRVRVGSASAA